MTRGGRGKGEGGGGERYDKGALVDVLEGVLVGVLGYVFDGVLMCVLEGVLEGILAGVLKDVLEGVSKNVLVSGHVIYIPPCSSYLSFFPSTISSKNRGIRFLRIM